MQLFLLCKLQMNSSEQTAFQSLSQIFFSSLVVGEGGIKNSANKSSLEENIHKS